MNGPAAASGIPVPQENKYRYESQLPESCFHGIAPSAYGHSHGQPGACQTGRHRNRPPLVSGQTEIDYRTDDHCDDCDQGDEPDDESVGLPAERKYGISIFLGFAGQFALAKGAVFDGAGYGYTTGFTIAHF